TGRFEQEELIYQGFGDPGREAALRVRVFQWLLDAIERPLLKHSLQAKTGAKPFRKDCDVWIDFSQVIFAHNKDRPKSRVGLLNGLAHLDEKAAAFLPPVGVSGEELLELIEDRYAEHRITGLIDRIFARS